MFAEFIEMYGAEIGSALIAAAFACLTAIAGYLGTVAKNLVKKYLDNKTKQDVAKTVVQGIEQVFKDLHGEEKLNKALEAASEMLTEKGITISELELRMLIEAAVGEFNENFKKK